MQSSFFRKRNFYSFIIFSIIMLSFQNVAFADDIDEIRELLKDGYYMPVSQEILDKPTIDEILAQLDPYTEYFTKQEFDDFINSIDMNYVGIGIIGEQHEKGVKVVHLFDTGAAVHSDLRLDDIIIEVNGTSLTGKTIEDAQQFLLGSPGTTAHLKVYRPSTKKTLSIDINRAMTEIAPIVESAWLGGNIGYIRLNSFNEDSVAELKKAMKSVGEVKGWIVDIRDNGGGYLDAAQDVAGFFPNVDVALIVEGQDHDAKVFLTNKQDPQLNGPIYLLVNSESASASEILAGAIQDQKGARIYGQTTYGKGVAQTVFQLSSGNFLKMTVAQFYTPEGKVINEIGITPDVETEIGDELETAHRDMLLLNDDASMLTGEKYNGTVPRNVEIGLKLDGVLSANKLKGQISLIKLGGSNVDINVVPTTMNSFTIIAKKLLDPNSSYLLKINSGTKDYVLSFKTSDKIGAKGENQVIFSDVKANDFFVDSATVLYNEGLLKGLGEKRFGPFTNVTREQAAVFFTRILGLDTKAVEDPGFTDVKSDTYYYKSVAAVKKAGIMSGKSKGQFGTGNVLTRGEMSALLARAFQLKAGGSADSATMPFADVASSPFKLDISKIYQSGLAGGTTKTTFSPEKTVTRGEFATFLYRALLNQKSTDTFAVEAVK
ncbi:S41 family peptidase [Schinkia sp. CFF1]